MLKKTLKKLKSEAIKDDSGKLDALKLWKLRKKCVLRIGILPRYVGQARQSPDIRQIYYK